jgi:hypothetical protein
VKSCLVSDDVLLRIILTGGVSILWHELLNGRVVHYADILYKFLMPPAR